MKTLTLFFITAMSASFVFSQAPLRLVKERVGNPDILKNWEVGNVKHINGATIQRLGGENDYESITNVFYTSSKVITNLVGEKAQAEAMLPVDRDELLETYEKSAPGGQIALFYCRPTKMQADPVHFSVNVLDEDGKVLWSGSLEKEPPYYYKWEIWYFYKTINVPVDVGQNFIVQVNDSAGRQSFRFKVFIHEQPTEKQPDLSLK